MVNNKNTPKGTPVPPDVRLAVSRDLPLFGEYKIAEAIGISPNALARVLAGLPVYGGTSAAVRAYVERHRTAA